MAIALACFAGAARGGVLFTTLDTLVPGGANSGGVEFLGQRYSEFAFRSSAPYDIKAADVAVRIGDDSVPNRNTIQFIFGTPTAATQVGDVFIDYRVDELTMSPMNRMGLRFVGSVPSQGAGAGSAILRQVVSTVNGADLAIGTPVSDSESLVLSNDGPGRLDDVNSRFLSLNLTYALRISTQVTLTAREDGRFDVAFQDQFSGIPEPTAVALAIPAGLVLLARRRRHA
jgi:hypothetical protein